MTELGAAAFMTRTIIALILAVVALLCFTYLYAHHVRNPLASRTTIDRIVIKKSARDLSVFANGKKLKTYRVALGRNPLGAKQEEGDKKTPEGIYKIDGRNPQSSFHLALHVSYPSDEDKARAAVRGVAAGSDIMIHGIRNGLGWIGAFHRLRDWTIGCVALTDEEIEELWRITPDGTTVEIRP
jgi:murein L,D-transpeptidase YafK